MTSLFPAFEGEEEKGLPVVLTAALTAALEGVLRCRAETLPGVAKFQS
ncbi:MAG: hypothetical protein K0U98_26555 [Deltaproteobacteria bacterium]|nr:hypothetical protein [Deltaproteobacteria bacterium]